MSVCKFSMNSAFYIPTSRNPVELLKGCLALVPPCRFHLQNQTRVMIAENVVSGTIQKLTSETWSANDDMEIRVVFAATEDSGYGGHRRYRGWTLAATNIDMAHVDHFQIHIA